MGDCCPCIPDIHQSAARHTSGPQRLKCPPASMLLRSLHCGWGSTKTPCGPGEQLPGSVGVAGSACSPVSSLCQDSEGFSGSPLKGGCFYPSYRPASCYPQHFVTHFCLATTATGTLLSALTFHKRSHFCPAVPRLLRTPEPLGGRRTLAEQVHG